MLALRWSAGPDVVVQSPASDLTLRAVDARGADRALAPVHPAPWLAVLALAVLAPSSVSWAEASSPPLVLEVALVDDPELPPLDDTLVARALAAASDTFAQRFAVTAPRFTVVARFGLESFMKRYAKASSPECSALLAARYKGGGRAELLTQKDAALRFFQRWPLEDLRTFVAPEAREAVEDYEALHTAYMDKYLATLATLESLSTPRGTPLIAKASREGRSHAAWSCALAAQRQFDVIITNTFILADILTEPHPHAVFGKAKVGGIAAPSPGRSALGGQALLASTFSIDTSLPFLSELGAAEVSAAERAEILGAFLLAHEIAHAVFGIPDVFDHPGECLMTTRPGETYHRALEVLREHPSPCPRCRPYVEARAAYDGGRRQLSTEPQQAVAQLADALRKLPKHFHGKKRRVSAIVLAASEGYAALGDEGKAKRYAALALESDPTSEAARAQYARYGGRPGVDVVSDRRTLPAAVVPSTAASVPASAPPLEPARTATAAR